MRGLLRCRTHGFFDEFRFLFADLSPSACLNEADLPEARTTRPTGKRLRQEQRRSAVRATSSPGAAWPESHTSTILRALAMLRATVLGGASVGVRVYIGINTGAAPAGGRLLPSRCGDSCLDKLVDVFVVSISVAPGVHKGGDRWERILRPVLRELRQQDDGADR
jgi:hypothetical protein